MTYPYLSDEQAARADALDVAHSLLSGTTVKGPLTASARAGLQTGELLPAVRLAEYVLTGHYTATAAEREQLDPGGLTASAAAMAADTEELETIAGATGSTEAGYL